MFHTDPGWKPSLRWQLWNLNPIPEDKRRRHTRRPELNALIGLRNDVLSTWTISTSLLLGGAAASQLDIAHFDWASAAVVVFSVLAVVGALYVRRIRLATQAADTLVHSYDRIVHRQLAAAWSTGLVASLGSLFTGSFWVCLLGILFTAACAWVAAPTKGEIKRRQRQITASGSSLSLLDALVESPQRTVQDRLHYRKTLSRSR